MEQSQEDNNGCDLSNFVGDNDKAAEELLIIEIPSSSNQQLQQLSLEQLDSSFHFDRQVFENISDLDLILIRAKHSQSGVLEQKDRNRLAKCVIKHVLSLNPNRQLDRGQFIQMANVLKDVFPSEETALYFLPSQNGAAASGALYYAYRSYRDELGSVGLAKLRPKQKRKADTVTVTTTSAITEADNDSLEYLKTQTDPRETVRIHWEKSYVMRIELLASLSNISYVQLFPVLQMGNGFEWILMDFDKKYPDAPKLWPETAAKIMKYSSSRRNKSGNLKALLNSSDAETHPCVLAIKVLPLILQSPTKSSGQKGNKKKKGGKAAMEPAADDGTKKTFRPSKPEVALDFIPHVINEGARTINDSDDFPRMTLVGQDLANAIMYVSIKNIDYGFSNPVQGLDACFKLYFALNCTYPVSVSHIWQFLDAMVYKISNSTDILPCVKTQVVDIANVNVTDVSK